MRNNTPLPHLNLSPPVRKHTPGKNILILDASFAIPLSYDIPYRFIDSRSTIPTEEQPKTYLDLLKFLPETIASEIHIPNAVVYEMIGYVCTRDPETNKLKSVCADPSFQQYGGYDNRVLFLRDALEDKSTGHPKIIIDCPKRGSEYLEKVLAERKSYNDIPHGYHVARARNIEEQEHYFNNHDRKLAHEIELENLRVGPGKDLGEILCAQGAFDYLGQNKASVTVLMDDTWGMRAIDKNARIYEQHYHAFPKISALNSTAFIDALYQAGILWQAGFNGEVGAEAIANDMAKQQIENMVTIRNHKTYVAPDKYTCGIDFAAQLQKAMDGPASAQR